MKLPNSNKSWEKRKYLLLKLADFSKRHVAVFAVVFGAIGGILLLSGSSAKLPAPTLYMTPESQNLTPGADFSVEVRMDSGSTTVNAVQANFSYPADLVDFVSIDATGSAFTTEAPSTGGSGTVSIARGNITPVSGDKLVAKVNFKAKAAVNGTVTLAYTTDTALMDATTNTDILGSLTKTTGAVFALGSGGPAPTPTPTPTPPAPTPTPTPTPGGPEPAPAAPAVYLSPSAKSVAPGADFSVEVRMNSGTVAVNAVQANFSYPAGLVDFVSISGTGSAFTTEAPSTGGSGTVSIARGNITPVTGDQIVAVVNFKAKTAAGTATMAFTGETALLNATTNTDILGGLNKTRGGTYTITSTNPTPTPTPPAPTPTPTPNPNPTPAKSGDINNDGKVDFSDLTMFLLRWGTSDSSSDFDKDGRVTIFDLSILLSNYGA